MTFEAFDVVVVPFPFMDRTTTKRRPALVLSDAETFNKHVGQSVLAMITSAKETAITMSRSQVDIPIENLSAAGLTSASVVRMKLFNLDDRLVVRKAGALAVGDRAVVTDRLRQLLTLKA